MKGLWNPKMRGDDVEKGSRIVGEKRRFTLHEATSNWCEGLAFFDFGIWWIHKTLFYKRMAFAYINHMYYLGWSEFIQIGIRR